MSTREDDIATFQAITGADDETAEHVLEAHGWDLNRGVNFYMESSDLDFRTPAPAPLSETRTRTSQVVYEDDDAIDLEEDEEPEILDHTQAPAESRPHPMLGEDNDDMLTAALTASLRTGVGEDEIPVRSSRPNSSRQRWTDDGDDVDDEDYVMPEAIEANLQRRESRRPTRSGPQLIPQFMPQLDDGPGSRIRRNRPRGAAAPDPLLGFFSSNGMAQSWPPPLLIDGRLPQERFGGSPGLSHPNRSSFAADPSEEELGESEMPNMPDGINMEEARMLEAAMLGIPYKGRIPDFSHPEEAEPISPSVMHERQLRLEQDQAYQDSLQADQVKADAAEAKQRAENEALRKVEEEREDAAKAQQAYERDIEEKLERLPAEPSANDPLAMTIQIRSPKGQKFGRRFRRSDQLSDLFSFVDTSGAPDFRPGQYKLVTQFPRRVFESSKEGTLVEGGLTQKQEALFLEPL